MHYCLIYVLFLLKLPFSVPSLLIHLYIKKDLYVVMDCLENYFSFINYLNYLKMERILNIYIYLLYICTTRKQELNAV